MTEIPARRDEAVEVIAGSAAAPVVITCEHASQRLPDGYAWPAADRWLVGSHWAYDLGAAELVEELCAAVSAPAVLARFSRLLIDPNRPADSLTLIREQAEGRPVQLNRQLAPGEREQRLTRYWRVYHAAVDAVVAASRAAVVLAIHSFTPIYEGRQRSISVGVLYDSEQELAEQLADDLRAGGLPVVMNEPYSGRQGMIYSAQHHATAHRRRAVEIEARQDLLAQPAFRRSLVAGLAGMAWPAA